MNSDARTRGPGVQHGELGLTHTSAVDYPRVARSKTGIFKISRTVSIGLIPLGNRRTRCAIEPRQNCTHGNRASAWEQTRAPFCEKSVLDRWHFLPNMKQPAPSDAGCFFCYSVIRRPPHKMPCDCLFDWLNPIGVALTFAGPALHAVVGHEPVQNALVAALRTTQHSEDPTTRNLAHRLAGR